MFSPLLTQIKNRYFSVDCGMGYVLRLTDGRFVIIDGGMNEPGEAEHLFDLLQSQNTNGTQPVIAAWLFSHPHDDHIGSFIDFCELFAAQAHIERLIYNFPSKETCPLVPEVPAFDTTVMSLTNTERITAKTGQQYRFADSVFDILLTQEDICPPIPNVNDSSMVVRTTIAGHRILWLGDAQSIVADRLCEMYTQEDLKCDILQVGHHGYGGGSDALHRAVDPDTLLWPVPDFTYQWVKDWDCNDYLMTSENIRRRYISGREEITLDLSQPLPPSFVETSPVSGETVYAEDFKDTDLFKLGWCCITGASVTYKAAELELQKGHCSLAANDTYSVCEFLQPRKLYKTNGYTLTFSCELQGKNAECGLFWNDETPMKRELERVWWLAIPKNAPSTVALIADTSAHTATVSVNGKPIETVPYALAEQHGLYFILRNAKFTVYEIKVVAQ